MYGIWNIEEQKFMKDPVLFDTYYWQFKTIESLQASLNKSYERKPENINLYEIRELPPELVDPEAPTWG